MQYQDYVNALNNKQLEAVESDSPYIRIVAGAGSGKTRVLTYRISFLISEMNIKPWNILAITFTNKVAGEMKDRLSTLVPNESKYLTIKTFHSLCALFLRQEISAIGFPLNFTILDEEDQEKIIKDIISSKGYKRNDPLVKQTLNYIGGMKLREKYPEDIKLDYEKFPNEKICFEAYEEYEETKNRQFALDFDDLILTTIKILENFPAIQSKWKNKFLHILVDEFQDTNNSEYKLLKLLMGEGCSLYVVGDPDQNIYTWRGAKQDIIINLHKEFPSLETIVLEENYRSTQSILDSANKLIAFNKKRLPKNLFTNNGKGSAITTRSFESGTLEAEYVAREIKSLRETKHYKYSDIVILYRSNYITLDFEKAFMAHNIPYVIYGGIKFYQRMEIKDVLAYFRLINNSKDDIAFERIINVPKRNIGEKSIELIKTGARKNKLSIYDYLLSDKADNELSNKIIISLRSLIARINITKNKIKEDDEMFSKTLEDLINDIGYYEYLKNLEDGDDRLDNVKSLFDDIRHYLKSNPDSSFDEYLQNVALVSAQDDIKDGEVVKLMTVHTAKGLEFPIVFIVRFNEGVFPNARAMSDNGFDALEEERRLAYVAYTRAKERLFLSYSEGFSYVNHDILSESQFIKQSGNFCTKQNRNFYISNTSNTRRTYNLGNFRSDNEVKFHDVPSVSEDVSQETNGITSWSIGDIVIHKKLGEGVVVAVEDETIIKVDFKEHGIKTLLGNHPAVSKGNK